MYYYEDSLAMNTHVIKSNGNNLSPLQYLAFQLRQHRLTIPRALPARVIRILVAACKWTEAANYSLVDVEIRFEGEPQSESTKASSSQMRWNRVNQQATGCSRTKPGLILIS